MKFILTKELGRLVRWLRILGFDCAYFTSENKSSLVITALREDRIIITRNHNLTKSAGINVVVLESELIKDQMKELMAKLNFKPDKELLFSRCIICNESLQSVEKSFVAGKVPEYVFKTEESFVSCPICKRIYWQGTHWGNVAEILKEVSLLSLQSRCAIESKI